ncbi:acyl carrier protein [Kitasatospora sp. NPDC006697]|uniref:acyl carrier protein n=1 Tax=Kitasatospora sp. NPDC006697 TaxID=3364020 RepID=UPI0036D11601
MNDRAEDLNPDPLDGAQPSGVDSDVPALVLSLANELLERTDVDPAEDFFRTGGDSILAMHLVGHLSRRTGLRLRVSLLFNHPVLSDFAEQVEQQRARQRAGADAGPTGPLAAALSAAKGAASAT